MRSPAPKRRRRAGLELVLAALLASSAHTARADGRRDLEDGIAFYENLDTERALARLEAAAIAKDLDAAGRAKAFLYLGMLQLEIGNRDKAERAWRRAFKLELGIAAPKGTSPKTIEALESARAAFRPDDASEPGGPKAGAPDAGRSSTPPPPPPQSRPDAGAGEAPDGGALVATGPGAAEDDGGPTWLIWVGLGVAAVAGASVAIYFATNSKECNGGGGCILLNVQDQ